MEERRRRPGQPTSFLPSALVADVRHMEDVVVFFCKHAFHSNCLPSLPVSAGLVRQGGRAPCASVGVAGTAGKCILWVGAQRNSCWWPTTRRLLFVALGHNEESGFSELVKNSGLLLRL